MKQLDLRGLLAVLYEHGVSFVAIGGVAVAAHGYVRATEDLDIVPEFEPANLARLGAALGEIDATLPTAGGRPFDPSGDTRELRQRRNLTLETTLGGLDVVQRGPGVPSFRTLDDHAVETELLGVPVRICSLPHLREMKRARATAQDVADLEGVPE